MIVNKDVIKELKPCKDRYDNYVNFYKDKSFSRRQFMGLKNITHNDKLWVAFRLMHKDKVRLAAADIAELVLPIYEAKYPNDNRPRKAIEAARSGKPAYAAYAAADAADAADAAAYAADAADAAAYAADAADAAYAAYRSNTASLKSGGPNLEKKIRTIILKYWK